MTQCNFCRLKNIKLRAKERGSRVIVRTASFKLDGRGMDVFVVPKGEKLPSNKEMIEPCNEFPNGGELWEKYHRAWMCEIPGRCSC